MKTTPLHTDYTQKADQYYVLSRPEMMRFVPLAAKKVLDVGCGSGGFGSAVKQRNDAVVWGIEPFENSAAQASQVLDRVFHSTVEECSELRGSQFDCIVFNDVLEHLVEPERALAFACNLLAPRGVVVASIPNIRHFPTLWQLLCHGRWDYSDCGILDRTHLRFFTRSSIQDLFRGAGLSIHSIEGINAFRGVPNASGTLWKLYRCLNFMLFNHLHDLRYLQFAVVGGRSG